MSDSPTVRLGEHEIPVYGQRWRYCVNRLEGVVRSYISETGEVAVDPNDINPTNLATMLGDSTYSALCALIPALGKRMPEWEFNGYASAEAAERGEYDPDKGNEPTIPEIINAFEVAWRVSRLDTVVGGAKGLIERFVDPTVLRDKITLFVAQLGEDPESPEWLPSPTSPSTNGTSGSTSSTPSSPTLTENGG